MSPMTLCDKLSFSNLEVPNTRSKVMTGIELYDRSTSFSLYGKYGLLGNVFLVMKLILLWLKFSWNWPHEWHEDHSWFNLTYGLQGEAVFQETVRLVVQLFDFVVREVQGPQGNESCKSCHRKSYFPAILLQSPSFGSWRVGEHNKIFCRGSMLFITLVVRYEMKDSSSLKGCS